MVKALTGAGNMSGLRNITKIPRSVKTIVSIAVLGGAAFLIWNHFQPKAAAPSTVASPSQIETLNQSQTNSYLNSKDYNSYQADRQTLATEYLTSQNPSAAERVMNEVLKNVPAGKINSSSYSILYQTEKAQGNVALEKKYLNLAITALKAEGKNDSASAAQKVLDSLK
jgi:hypothetical protein